MKIFNYKKLTLLPKSFLMVFILSTLFGFTSNKPIEHVANNFHNPSSESGVNAWWWWLNGNITKAAITKDLEAMKSKNFQGAMIFDAGGHNQRRNKNIPAGPLFGSDEWNELFVFSLDEAKRLGLELSFNIQSGWNLGGPRVTPKYAAKQLTYSEIKVKGGIAFSEKLAVPKTRNDFYEDIMVLAFPIPKDQKKVEGIVNLDYKLGFYELGMSAPDTRFLLENTNPQKKNAVTKPAHIINKDEVLDLTSKLDAQGKLQWTVPEGEWTILRIGYTSTDSHVSTSSGDWKGNVLDYMSTEAFDFYWNDVVEPIFEAAGGHVGNTLKYMETDSWECGGMNWTETFSQEFIKYRGYDLKQYLPIVAGYIVNDLDSSNAFLSDFRKTLGDLVAYNHYAVFQKYAHKYNMGIQPESAGPHAGPMDGIKNYGFSDIVMSEFWSPSPHRPWDKTRFFLKQASSAAHIYGKKIVGAESFTTVGPHWNDELWKDQKSAFDHEIAAGLNRMYFHTFTSSPPEMGLPGQEYFAGTHVNPQVTWWKQSGAFIDYMHRVQSVVQEGKFVADVLYYYGDHVPNVFGYKNLDPAGALPGFDYDVTDETILLQLIFQDGKLVVPGGVKYRVLVLPDHKTLSFAALQKVDELLQLGANVIGYKPNSSSSLVGGKSQQQDFTALANKIWGNNPLAKGNNKHGKGLISWGVTAREFLLAKNIPTDFNVVNITNNNANNDKTNKQRKTDVDYIHYTIGKSDVYFVTNQSTNTRAMKAQFRVTGKQPYLWDAITGNKQKAQSFSQHDAITELPLILEPYASVFVVFNETIAKDTQGSSSRNYPEYKAQQEITGTWQVLFDPKWGGPKSVVFPTLTDWTKHTNDGIKYYSGAATYKKSFAVNFAQNKNQSYWLELGSVKDVGIAEVKINGIDKGIVWTPPFRVDISNELKQGENTLEIKVINSWFNRVTGDQTNPNKKQYTKTNIVITNDFRGRPLKEIKLEPSGLIGPVTIKTTVN